MKLAIFTVMLPDMTPEKAAQEIKAAGYDGVEWRVTNVPDDVKDDAPSFWGNNLCTLSPTEEDAKRARQISEEAGLETPTIGTYIRMNDIEGVKAAIKFAQVLGCKQFRVGFGNFTGNYTEQFEAAKSFLAEAIDLAKGAQLKPLVEIHHRTIVPSASLMYRLVSNFSPSEVGVIHDAGNMVHEGFEDYRMGLELLGDYLAEVHIKNASYEPKKAGVWQSGWSPLRNGVVDFNALFGALKASGYDGWLAVEDFSKALPSKEALADNIAFIKEAWEAA